MKTNKGFTLIELMVVILIIGILSAIAIPEYTRSMEKARVTEAITIMDSIKKAVDVWVAENGFPSSKTDLIGSSGSAVNRLDINIESDLNCSGDYCAGKYFNFNAYCESSFCLIRALRGADVTNPSSAEYRLHMTKFSSTLRWARTCTTNSTEVGDQICEMLRGQSWNYNDGSGDY